MVTKFDIGDVIQFEVTGKIVAYTCAENEDDGYTIEFIAPYDKNRISSYGCISSVELEECHAVKVEDNEIKNNETRKEE